MTRDEAFEFTAQGFTNSVISKELIKRIALSIARRPHLLDVGIPIHRIPGYGEQAITRADLKPLRAKGMRVLCQMGRNAGQDLYIAFNERGLVLAHGNSDVVDILGIKRRQNPASFSTAKVVRQGECP